MQNLGNKIMELVNNPKIAFALGVLIGVCINLNIIIK